MPLVRAVRLALLLAAAVLLLGVAACGGDDDDESAGTTPAATQAETGGGGGGDDGAAVFASAGCGGCHTLAAAGSSGMAGPNLDDLKPSKEQVEDQVRSGGGGMPSFDGQLSDDQIEAVAEYFSSSAGS
jgi:mono/diheme cytochrome c family protein